DGVVARVVRGREVALHDRGTIAELRGIELVLRVVALSTVKKTGKQLVHLDRVYAGESKRSDSRSDVGVVFPTELRVADVRAAGPDFFPIEHEEFVVHDVAVARACIAHDATRSERRHQRP